MLMWGCESGCDMVVKELIESGVDLHAKTGSTARALTAHDIAGRLGQTTCLFMLEEAEKMRRRASKNRHVKMQVKIVSPRSRPGYKDPSARSDLMGWNDSINKDVNASLVLGRKASVAMASMGAGAKWAKKAGHSNSITE